MTETALADLLAADLSGLDLVALMIDGVHFAEHLCVVALGIDIDGTKHPLALVEGSTENTTLVTEPAGRAAGAGPGHHPADPGRASTAPRRWRPAVKEVFDQPVIARCQLHKLRNVRDHLPEKHARSRRQADAHGLPRRLRARGRGAARGAGHASWTRPTPAPPAACARAWPRR